MKNKKLSVAKTKPHKTVVRDHTARRSEKQEIVALHHTDMGTIVHVRSARLGESYEVADVQFVTQKDKSVAVIPQVVGLPTLHAAYRVLQLVAERRHAALEDGMIGGVTL